MIDLQIYIIGFSAVSLVLLLGWMSSAWETRRAARGMAEARKRYDEGDMEVVAVRDLYGARLVEFEGSEHEYADSFEVCEAGEDSYTRVMVDFPSHVSVPLTLMKESSDEIYKKLLALRELEIGDEAFDDMFLILAHDRVEFEAYVSDEIRAQLLDLAPDVDELKLGSDGIFLQCNRVLNQDQLQDVLARAHKVAVTYFEHATSVDAERLAALEKEASRQHDEGHFGLHARDL